MTSFKHTVTPAVTTNAYTLDDLVGSINSIQNNKFNDPSVAILDRLRIVDKDRQNAKLSVIIFERQPVQTTFVENSPFTPNYADLDRVLTQIEIAAADYTSNTHHSVAEKGNLGIPVAIPSAVGTGVLWTAIKAGANVGYSSTSSLALTLMFR